MDQSGELVERIWVVKSRLNSSDSHHQCLSLVPTPGRFYIIGVFKMRLLRFKLVSESLYWRGKCTMGSLAMQARRGRHNNTNHPGGSASKHRDHIDHTIAYNLLVHKHLATRFSFLGVDPSWLSAPRNSTWQPGFRFLCLKDKAPKQASRLSPLQYLISRLNPTVNNVTSKKL